MASTLIDYCERTNPMVFREMKPRAGNGAEARRIHEAFTAAPERRLMVWIAERLPSWINSDHLTALGFVGQILAGLFYALARYNQDSLLAVIACLAVNWLGDSLDGTLARVRQQPRPRYGFYVDHMLDSLGAVAMMIGLARSGYMHPYLAIGLLVVFLLLSIQSYLATYTLNEFHLSFWKFGPTELRLLLTTGNLALLWHPMVLHGRFRLFDVGGTIGLIGMSVMLVFFTMQNAYQLYRQEPIQ